MRPTPENIGTLFTYHAPRDDQGVRYVALREHALQFARLILEKCPETEERTLAIRKLQECIMWANASIAINE